MGQDKTILQLPGSTPLYLKTESYKFQSHYANAKNNPKLFINKNGEGLGWTILQQAALGIKIRSEDRITVTANERNDLTNYGKHSEIISTLPNHNFIN